MYLLLVCAHLPEHWLTAAYIALNEHDHINVDEQLESYTHMFQHGVPRETWQCIIMRGIETVTRDYCRNFRKYRLKQSVWQDISFQVQITVLAEHLNEESLLYIHGVSVIVLRSLSISPVNELKNSRDGKHVFCNFSTQSMYSYEKTPFRVRRSKSFALSLQNS